MNYSSMSLSFRIGLAFHALNNEGSSGTNVMEPRRISVGGENYDGISGEMVRRHVFENLVQLAKKNGLALSPEGEGLLPDRAKTLIKAWLDKPDTGVEVANGNYELQPQHLPALTRAILGDCAVTDIGGYLAAFDSKDKTSKGNAVKGATPKRDSTFDVGWLISEEPAIVEYSQHAAYRPDGQHNLFTQNMRAAVYGGVARLDLGRIGRNDWAWMKPQANDLHLSDTERASRAGVLIDAWEQWLLSPGGAKQAGWLQHNGLLEGAIVLSNFGPAPFRSSIEVKLDKQEQSISHNKDYLKTLKNLETVKGERYKVFTFNDQAALVTAFDSVRKAIGF